jgi:hypothetical protein
MFMREKYFLYQLHGCKNFNEDFPRWRWLLCYSQDLNIPNRNLRLMWNYRYLSQMWKLVCKYFSIIFHNFWSCENTFAHNKHILNNLADRRDIGMTQSVPRYAIFTNAFLVNFAFWMTVVPRHGCDEVNSTINNSFEELNILGYNSK